MKQGSAPFMHGQSPHSSLRELHLDLDLLLAAGAGL